MRFGLNLVFFEPQFSCLVQVRAFVERAITPHVKAWEDARRMSPEVYLEAGRAGMLAGAAGDNFSHFPVQSSLDFDAVIYCTVR